MKLRLAFDPNLNQAPATRALLILNILFWLAGWAGDALGIVGLSSLGLRDLLGLFPSRVISEGMFWTPFTYMFLHGNGMHLTVNMLGLYLLGPDLERTFRPAHFLCLYLASGLLGGLAYLLISHLIFGQLFPCVGASGAIMGLLGAIVAIYPQRIYVLLPLMIPMRAAVLAVLLVSSHLFFLLTPYGGNVAYDVHLFGGFAGFLYAWVLSRVHRHHWRAQWEPSGMYQARLELEELLWRVAREGEASLDSAETERMHQLQQALQYEDVPTLEELKSYSA